MRPSEQPAWFLDSIDRLLSSDAIQAFFLVDTVLMLIGMITVAVLVWKHLPVNFWHKVLLEAALFFVGIGLSGTAYETYYIVHIVDDEKSQITKISKDLDTLSKKLEAQITQETSLKVEALSRTAEETSGTVEEILHKVDNLKCPPPPCRHKACRSDCASKTSFTVPPSQSDSEPSHPAVSALQADGWVYVGTRAGLEWDEKYFDWDGEKDRLPGKGDILTATGSVHLRVPLGCQASIVGAIAPGEQVHVLRAQTVADCHHWVQVKRM